MKYSDLKTMSTGAADPMYFIANRSEPSKKTGKFIRHYRVSDDLLAKMMTWMSAGDFDKIMSDDSDRMLVRVNPDQSQDVVLPNDIKKLFVQNAHLLYEDIIDSNKKSLDDYESRVTKGDVNFFFRKIEIDDQNYILKRCGLKEGPKLSLPDMDRIITKSEMKKLQKSLKHVLESNQKMLSEFKY